MRTINVQPHGSESPTLQALVGDSLRNWAGLEVLVRSPEAERLLGVGAGCSHQTLRAYARHLKAWGQPGFSDLAPWLPPDKQVLILKMRKLFLAYKSARAVREYLVSHPL